jgi:hypothetical protein
MTHTHKGVPADEVKRNLLLKWIKVSPQILDSIVTENRILFL